MTLVDFNELPCALMEVMQRDLDKNARAVEEERCGSQRLRRKCNECRFQLNELQPGPNGCGGCLDVPFVPSRRLPLGSLLDRYFPGLKDCFESKLSPFDARIMKRNNDNARQELWTLYMGRCRWCHRWQEMRACRVGGWQSHWQPAVIGLGIYNEVDEAAEGFIDWDCTPVRAPWAEALRCNTCFVQLHGDKALGDALSNGSGSPSGHTCTALTEA